MTVRQLMEMLEDYDPNSPVLFYECGELIAEINDVDSTWCFDESDAEEFDAPRMNALEHHLDIGVVLLKG